MGRKVLFLISADAEWRAVKQILAPKQTQNFKPGEYFPLPYDGAGVSFFHGGWGKISAAATTQFCIDQFQPDVIVNLGTCGGFAGQVEPGTVIWVTRTVVYDIVEQMSDPEAAIAHYASDLDQTWMNAAAVQALEDALAPLERGLLISADRDIVPAEVTGLVEKYGVAAADWESGAIAWVAKKNGVKCLILRGVTDLVDSSGGEAYGRIDLFVENTRRVMGCLIGLLPEILAAVGYGETEEDNSERVIIGH